MLVTFTSSAYADLTMFGDVAVRLLKMMGHSGTVPSALVGQDVGAARRRLETAIAAQQSEPLPNRAADAGNQDQDEEPAVSLSQRAVPVIELLKAAEQAEADVLWKSN